MRLIASLCLVLVVGLAGGRTATADRSNAATAADANEIRRVIRTQLHAFRRGDAGTAFRLAAPSIQARYGTPEYFLAIVRRHYSPVYRSRTASFGRLAMWRGSVTQEVAIVAEDGRRYTALYPMQRLARGVWRIAGCLILHDRSI
jgi:hypothetical protein